ncbi:MAG: helix-turn-helix transcriptional regulator [Chthoniobacterales bacterium]
MHKKFKKISVAAKSKSPSAAAGAGRARRGKRTVVHSRPPLARMLYIHEELGKGHYPNCNSLGYHFEVSYKTIQRDIDFMRDQLCLPIRYDAQRHGFVYTESVRSFPTVAVSEGELVALLVAQKAIEQYRGTPFEKPIASAFQKLAGSLDAERGISLHQLSEAFSFKPASLAKRDLEEFQILAEAVMHQNPVTFSYRSLQGERVEKREVEPYHLGCIADQWYVIGRDIARGQLRTFALPRLKNLKRSSAQFETPKDFNIQKVLKDSFSAFEAQKIETVKLKLDPLATQLTKERKWHASQSLTKTRGNDTLLTLRVGLAPDLENWILSWGVHVKVLAPKALKISIAAQLKQAAEAYK